jgi:pyrroloquinoline quinone biosynthesis protein D
VSGAPATAKPALGHGLRLQWEPAQDAHVLLFPEGQVKLNGSAGQIMIRCDGKRSVAQIVADLETTYGASGLGPDVEAFIALAVQKRWLELRE